MGVRKRPDLAERNRKNAKHNMTISPTYFTWAQMKKRCKNPKNVAFKNYGGRGIKVCDEWSVFENFLNDMGIRPDGTELDRIDVNGNYEPSNCRWVTRRENSNNRRNNKRIEFNGENLTYSDWSRKTGLCKTVIRRRILLGWSIEKTLTTKSRGARNKKENLT